MTSFAAASIKPRLSSAAAWLGLSKLSASCHAATPRNFVTPSTTPFTDTPSTPSAFPPLPSAASPSKTSRTVAVSWWHVTSGRSAGPPVVKREETQGWRDPGRTSSGSWAPKRRGRQAWRMPRRWRRRARVHSRRRLSTGEPACRWCILASALSDTTGTTTRHDARAWQTSRWKSRPCCRRCRSQNTSTARPSTTSSDSRKNSPAASSSSSPPVHLYERNTS
mmetsp:Transcript_16143/g.33193  ORF Transcript_16143/g.33193 Transcript_16143/m.33193 type:complete len:222 (+) Transcript_16143:381-1046(+)